MMKQTCTHGCVGTACYSRNVQCHAVPVTGDAVAAAVRNAQDHQLLELRMALSGLIMGMLSSAAHKAAPSSTSMREPDMLSERQHRDVKTRTFHCRPKQARALLTDRFSGHLLLD